MNWILWTTLLAMAAFMLRFVWHYRRHFQNSIDQSFHWTRRGEYQGPPLPLLFRYRDANQGPWRVVSANIGEVVRYGDVLFLKGLEEGSLIPRIFRMDSLTDLRERPHGTPVALDEITARVQRQNEAIKNAPEFRRLPAIYSQA